MAKTRRKPNAFIKKVVAYYNAHKKEGIEYSDAIKKVAQSYKKGGQITEEEEKLTATAKKPETETETNTETETETNTVINPVTNPLIKPETETREPVPVSGGKSQQQKQGGRRKSGKKSKKTSRRTRRK